MEQHPLIGVRDDVRDGNASVAGILVEEHGFQRIALATPLRVVASRLYRLLPEDTDQRELEDILGDALRDTFGVDALVRHCEEGITGLAQDRPVVVTDIRRDDEAAWLRSIGGAVIRVVQSHQRCHEPLTRTGIHPPGHDITVVDDGDGTELAAKLERLEAGGWAIGAVL